MQQMQPTNNVKPLGDICFLDSVCVTCLKQLVDFVTAQVGVDVHLEAQFAEVAVEFLGVLLSSGPPPQIHPRVKLCDGHHHCPVTLPAATRQFSPLRHCSSLRYVVRLCGGLSAENT